MRLNGTPRPRASRRADRFAAGLLTSLAFLIVLVLAIGVLVRPVSPHGIMPLLMAMPIMVIIVAALLFFARRFRRWSAEPEE